MTQKLEAEPILQQLAEIRSSIPDLQATAPPASDLPAGIDGVVPRDLEEFEYAALADAIASFAAELAGIIERKSAEATAKALEVYYTAEEMARDPEHANLIPHVEAMRRAYEHDFGRPIPPRARTSTSD